MKLTTIAVRNLARNRRRSVLSAAAIGVAAAAVSFLFALLAGYVEDIETNLQSHYVGAVRIRNREYNRYDYLNPMHLSVDTAGELVRTLESIPEVTAVSPRIPFPAALFQDDDRRQLQGLGVDIRRDREFQNLDTLLVGGRLPRPDAREGVLGTALADKLGIEVGDTLTILSTTKYRSGNAMSFEIVGLVGYPVAGIDSTRLVVPLSAAERLVRMDNQVVEILLKTAPGTDDRHLAAALESEQLPPHLEAESWKDISTSYEMIESARAMYNIIALFFVLLGSTVIINTTMMVIYERLREVGTLAALGMRGGRLVKLFFLESLLLAVLGGFAGVAVGVGVAWPLSIYGINLGSAMEGVSFEISTIIRPQITYYSTAVVFVGTVLISSLATLVVARRVAGIDPVAALAAP